MQTENACQEINDAVAEFTKKFDQLSSDYIARVITTPQYDQRARQLHQEFAEKLEEREAKKTTARADVVAFAPRPDVVAFAPRPDVVAFAPRPPERDAPARPTTAVIDSRRPMTKGEFEAAISRMSPSQLSALKREVEEMVRQSQPHQPEPAA